LSPGKTLLGEMPADPFGRAFADFLSGKKVTVTQERDDGHIDRDDVSHYFCGFNDFIECEQ